MIKSICKKATIVLLSICILSLSLVFNVEVAEAAGTIVYENIFENSIANWFAAFGGEIALTDSEAYSGTHSLMLTNRTQAWHSPAINIYSYIKNNGAGTYNISARIMTDKINANSHHTRLIIRGTNGDSYSFMEQSGSNYYGSVTTPVDLTENHWSYLSGNVLVEEDDIQEETGTFNLMIDVLNYVAGQKVYLDDLRIVKVSPIDSGFYVNPSGRTIKAGESFLLTSSYNPALLTYTSSNSRIVSVDSNGIVTGITPGKVRIEIKSKATRETKYVYVVVSDGWYVVKNGTYFIQNTHFKNYMQIDNNKENSGYNDNNVIIEAWNYDGEDAQKWNFEIQPGGYYKITSCKSGKALTIKNVEEEQELVQETYVNSSSQHWYVEPVYKGKYKIWPEVTKNLEKDWCAAPGDAIIVDEIITNGRNVKNRLFNNLSDDRGMWEIREFNTVLYGVTNAEHDHETALSSIKSKLEQENIGDVNFKSGAFTTTECKNDLKSHNVFVSRGHGTARVVEGKVVSTAIILDDGGTGATGLYSHYNISGGYITPDDDFSQLHIAFFIGCETGKGGVGGNNLPSRVVELGARAAVGFEEIIFCNSANQWTETVFERLLDGETLQEAIEEACDNIDESYGLHSYVIAGDAEITLP